MKVIHANYEAERYGIGTYLLNLLEFQKENFKDLQVAVAFNEEGPHTDKFRNLGIPVYSLRHRTARDSRLLFKFYKVFQPYDIVNLHVSSPLAFFAAKLAGKKIVFTFHGSLGLKGNSSDVLLKIFHSYLVPKYCDFLTFASQSAFNVYTRGRIKVRLSPEKFRIFPYGIQVKKVVPQRSRDEVRACFGWNSRFLIGTASRMDPYKRLEYLVQAFSGLDQRDNYSLVIMGTGDKNYENSLRKLVQHLHLSDRVHFLGYRSDARDIINSLDLFVLPSGHESFGLALLEAMALGVPSAVFEDGGGLVDIIGDSGLVVSSKGELRDSMKRLKEDDSLRNRIRESVRERSKLFDISFTAENLFQIYRNLLSNCRS